MGRLIDADVLIEDIKRSAESKKKVVSGIVLQVSDITHKHIIEIVKLQPTVQGILRGDTYDANN